jgi:hypothetical protein
MQERLAEVGDVPIRRVAYSRDRRPVLLMHGLAVEMHGDHEFSVRVGERYRRPQALGTVGAVASVLAISG